MGALFAVTIFLSAFLLFQVQPMIGRYILPWFGGTPAVWSVCLLFFQAVLLAGYGYAHWLASLRSAMAQTAIHSALLLASLLLLPIIPEAAVWKPDSPDNPSGRILTLLAAVVGGPYFILSATAPLLQRWFTVTYPDRPPWRLYALSNAGSLIALLSYPFLMEPFFRMQTQGWTWSALYAAFAAICGFTAWKTAKVGTATQPEQIESERPALATVAYWLALAAAGSTLLLATTNLITQDIASVPFLWILPLAIYLLTFILAFEHDRWYHRMGFAVLAGILTPAATAVTGAGILLPVWGEAGVYLAALFATCMICHGELRLARPAPKYLTAFYLIVAAGGVLGGVFVALISPSIFKDFTEYLIGLMAGCSLGLLGWFRSGAYAQWTRQNFAVRVPLMALLFGTLGALFLALSPASKRPLESARNFFGILRVTELSDSLGTYRQLSHGRIKHGSQYQDPKLRRQPVSYYGMFSGVSLVMGSLAPQPRRIAVVGLGTGTMAAWGRKGDTVRFYEINPEVERIARESFTYVKESEANVEIVLGDARIQLERELAQGQSADFEMIVVDAFSSDAIPMHLLTAECGDIYSARLEPDGKMLLHISNRSLDLEPIVRGLARHMNMHASQLLSSGNPAAGEDGSRWILFARDPEFLKRPRIASFASGWSPQEPFLWTDDFSSLWHVLRW